MSFAFISAFFIYFCTLISIGFFFFKKKENLAEFMIGNRSANYWVTAIATQASDMGSWLFLAFPAALFMRGLFECWTAFGLIVFMFLTWHFVAPQLRRLSELYGSVTLASFLNHRFGDHKGRIGFISACITLIFFTFYIASGLVGLGRLFATIFAINYHTGILISLATVLIFTLCGGFLAVVWTNLFQGIFLLAAIIIVPLYAWFANDTGLSLVSAAAVRQVPLSLFNDIPTTIRALLLSVGWGLGYFGQPHILVNFMGINDPRTIIYATYVGMSWMIAALTAAVCVGLMGMIYFPYGLDNPENLFIALTQYLFSPFLAGLIICGVLAATLSSMDTQILISGSTFAEDIYKRIYPRASIFAQLWATRIGSLLIALAALIISWNNSNSVYDLVNYAWSGLGASFGPLMLVGLTSKKITLQTALAGLLTGAFVTALWPYIDTSILPLIPGFFSSLMVIYSASYFTHKKIRLPIFK